MQIQVITERSGAEALHAEWSVLLDEAPAPSVFLTPEWMLAWWHAHGDGLEMYLVTVRDAGRLVGVFPLAYRVGRRWGLPRRVLQGWSNDYTDRFGPIVAEDSREAVEVAARYLVNDAPPWGRFDLKPLSTGDPVTGWLADALGAVGVGASTTGWWESPIVDLAGDPGTLRTGLSGSFRSTLRRKAKAADREGLAAEIREDAAALDEAFDVAGESWAHEQGTGIGSTPQNRQFYRGLAAAAEGRGWLRIALLRTPDGNPIAFELNLVRNREAVNLKLGYRAPVGSLSPGLVLRGHVMDALIAEGCRTFDLLGSAEPYKLHWTGRTVPHVRLRGFPPTLLGRMRHRYRHRLRPVVRKALDRVRRPSEDAG